jgi:hypothetical protein
VKTLYSRRTAKLLIAAVASAGALVTAGAFVLPASAGQAAAQQTSVGAATHRSHTLTVRQIAFGKKLHHKFRPNGTGAWKTEALSDPDDITMIGRHLYVTFQNNLGPQGQASPSGDLDSTIVEFTLSGHEVRQWDLAGHCDGLTADPFIGQVIATVNEDANSSLFTIAVGGGRVTRYKFNKPLPHKGGSDAISIYFGQILISASAPGTNGAPAPQPTYPAVYVTTLDFKTKVATVHALFYDEATAKAVNGPHASKPIKLGLTDPDSNEVVPWVAPKFRGDFMLDSQGDQELIFDHVSRGWHQSLSVLSLPRSVDDSAWATTPFGALYTTDATADTVDTVSGGFRVGAMYSAVTPCDQNDAPATCPGPGFPPNYLASGNMMTGTLTKVALAGAVLNPKGMIFVPFA